jgi:hypothetical protein
MYYTLLLFQFTAHLLADFTFQPQRWCETKDQKLFSKEIFYHALVVFGCAWVLSFRSSFWWAALLIAASHFLLDILKGYVYRKNILRKLLFFIDQFLHIAIIIFVVWLFECMHMNTNYTAIFLPSANAAFIVFAIIACTKPANICIKKTMEANCIFPIKDESKAENTTLMNAGRIIGALERVLSFILILVGQWAGLGFIIAAKTILRFRDTDTAKTEYVLIGSLLSFGIAILLGISYQYIKQ